MEEFDNTPNEEKEVINPSDDISPREIEDTLKEDEVSFGVPSLDVAPVITIAQHISDEISKVIIGQKEMIELMTIALILGEHVLLEGVPGIAKTLAAKSFAKIIKSNFSRIQFTPDLMPADVTGTTVFNMKTTEFIFKKGPIFSNIVLIDEINRAPAKTQAALFEVMEEHQVTIDGETHKMSMPFIIMATQNPIEQEGTFRLPEAQLDRFIFKIVLSYPSETEELEILQRFEKDFEGSTIKDLKGSVKAKDIQKAKAVVEKVYIKKDLLVYISKIVHYTRNSVDIYLGASPRASLYFVQASKVIAALAGRSFVTPEDIQYVSYHILNHRIILTPEREIEGLEIKEVIKDIFQKIEVPR